MKLAQLRYFAPFGNPGAVAAEALLLPLLAVGLGIWINPLDPLWTHAGFPWAWFAPVVLAMRYGPFPGLAGAAVLLLAWFVFSTTGWLPGEFPKQNFLGGLILVMLAGEFSSLWLARARRAEGVQVYLDRRLEYLTHQYYLLRLSHDRLEQDLIGRPMAMRDALGALQAVAAEESETAEASEASGATDASGEIAGRRRLPGADGLLRLFAQYCQLEAAALYPATADGIAARPCATLGQLDADGRLAVDDPLVAHALESGQLSHIAGAPGGGDRSSRYVIVAPLTSFGGETLGLLTVERVPFFALHEEMLQTLNLLLGYYTDGLLARELAADIRAAYPDCPAEFAAELQRLWRVSRESQVRSVLVALQLQAHAEIDDLAAQIRRQRRALDVNWLIEKPQRKLLVTLMPLAGSAAAEGYIARIEEWVRQKSGQTLEAAGIFPHVLRVEDKPPRALLKHLFDICNVPDQVRPLRTDA